MKTIRSVAALIAIGSVAACGGAQVTPAPSTTAGGAGSTASSSSTAGAPSTGSTSSSSHTAPTAGTTMAGSALASTMQSALSAIKSVQFSVTRVPIASSDASASASSAQVTDKGALVLADPLTATYTDAAPTKRDVVVVDGVAYGFFKQSNVWVKQSSNPDALESSYLVKYLSQVGTMDPRVISDMVKDGSVVVKGQSQVAGVSVTQYSVTATFTALIDAQVNSMKKHGCDVLAVPSNRTSLASAKASNGTKQFTFEVYLDQDNRLVRYQEPVASSESGTRLQSTYSGFGAPVDAKAPSDAKPFSQVRDSMSSASPSSS